MTSGLLTSEIMIFSEAADLMPFIRKSALPNCRKLYAELPDAEWIVPDPIRVINEIYAPSPALWLLRQIPL